MKCDICSKDIPAGEEHVKSGFTLHANCLAESEALKRMVRQIEKVVCGLSFKETWIVYGAVVGHTAHAAWLQMVNHPEKPPGMTSQDCYVQALAAVGKAGSTFFNGLEDVRSEQGRSGSNLERN